MNLEDFYSDDSSVKKDAINIERRSDLRNIYHAFFNDFREYLVDFVGQSMSELNIAEILVNNKPVKLFKDQSCGRYVTIKNQGSVSCYIGLEGSGGFRLDPGEKERFWANKPIVVLTTSGNTTVGLLQS